MQLRLGVKGYSPHGCDDQRLAAPKGPLAWGFLGRSGFPWVPMQAIDFVWFWWFLGNNSVLFFVLFLLVNYGESISFRCLNTFKPRQFRGLSHPQSAAAQQLEVVPFNGVNEMPVTYKAAAAADTTKGKSSTNHTLGCLNWKEHHILGSFLFRSFFFKFTTHIQSYLYTVEKNIRSIWSCFFLGGITCNQSTAAGGWSKATGLQG